MLSCKNVCMFDFDCEACGLNGCKLMRFDELTDEQKSEYWLSVDFRTQYAVEENIDIDDVPNDIY